MVYYRQYPGNTLLVKNHDRMTIQYGMCLSDVQTACIPNTNLDSCKYISLLRYLMLFPAEKIQEVFTFPQSSAAVIVILLLMQPVAPVWEEQNLNSRRILALYAIIFLRQLQCSGRR